LFFKRQGKAKDRSAAFAIARLDLAAVQLDDPSTNR
jgi:hypothetical protein